MGVPGVDWVAPYGVVVFCHGYPKPWATGSQPWALALIKPWRRVAFGEKVWSGNFQGFIRRIPEAHSSLEMPCNQPQHFLSRYVAYRG